MLCFLAFSGAPKIHADLPPRGGQRGAKEYGFPPSEESEGLHVFEKLLKGGKGNL